MSPLLALSVIRRTAIFLDAIGGIADIGRRWREMVMTLMTHSGHSIEVSRNYDVPYANDCSRPFSHFGERSAA